MDRKRGQPARSEGKKTRLTCVLTTSVAICGKGDACGTQEQRPIPAKTDQPNGLGPHSRNPHRYWARTAQMAQQPNPIPVDKIARALWASAGSYGLRTPDRCPQACPLVKATGRRAQQAFARVSSTDDVSG